MSDELPTSDAPTAPAVTPPSAPPPRTGIFVPRWVVVVVILAVLFAGGVAIGRWALGNSSSTSSEPSPSTTAPAPSTTPIPDALALSRLVLQQTDVSASFNVQLLPGGSEVRGQTTLDLCNGKFATESRRVARLQDVVQDNQGNSLVSTEAVLYRNVSDSVEAFNELRQVAASCPKGPVVSPVGEPTVTTHFNAAPDGNWPQTPTVDRLAYSFTSTEQSGQKQPSIAVYLRRGRALMGVYFTQPDSTQPKVAGQDTVPGIVSVFAGRLAALPVSTVQ